MRTLRYRRNADGLYVPGYPADPEQELTLPNKEADRLLDTGLYKEVHRQEEQEARRAEASAPAEETPKPKQQREG